MVRRNVELELETPSATQQSRIVTSFLSDTTLFGEEV